MRIIRLFRDFPKRLNESTSNFVNNIDMLNDIDGFVQEDLNNKLIIINKYFPFKKVEGVYDGENGSINLTFDNGVSIVGYYGQEPFISKFRLDGNEYEFDEHPFDGLGGLDTKEYEESIKGIYQEENFISLVVSHDGYASTSITIPKQDLEKYKFNLVKGTQIEGKILGETKMGKGSIKELWNMFTDKITQLKYGKT